MVVVQAFMTGAGEQGVLLASLGTIAEPGMLPAHFVLPLSPMHWKAASKPPSVTTWPCPE